MFKIRVEFFVSHIGMCYATLRCTEADEGSSTGVFEDGAICVRTYDYSDWMDVNTAVDGHIADAVQEIERRRGLVATMPTNREVCI